MERESERVERWYGYMAVWLYGYMSYHAKPRTPSLDTFIYLFRLSCTSKFRHANICPPNLS